MFTPKSQGVTRSSSQTGGTGRMVATPGSTRGRGGLFATKRKSQALGLARSFNASDFESRIAEQSGADHILREYGAAVPVLVTETLTLSDRGAQSSVKLDCNGWAWLVCGRRLIIWNYKTNKSGQCYDLSLPASCSLYDARLVTVFECGDQQAAACVAVSREGSIRFWHNVSLEGSYAELKAELSGGEFVTIVALEEFGCIVGTTVNTLVSVNFSSNSSGLKYRTLKLPQGRLGGIGRYVSSMFFGSTPQPSTKPQPILVSMLVGEMLDEDFQALYVLTSEGLQKWAVGQDTERMLYQMNLEHIFMDNLAETVWNQEPKNLPQLKTEFMDMQLINDGVIIFGGGINCDMSNNNVHYALGTLHTEGEDTPQSFLDFKLVNHSQPYNDTARLPSYRLILPRPNSRNVFLYDTETIICITDGRAQQTPELVDFPNLGAGFINGVPVFLSNQGLIVCVQDNVQAIDTSVSDSLLKTTTFAKLDTSIVSTAKRGRISEVRSSDDKLTLFKSAFLSSIQDTGSQSEMIIRELFPEGVPLSSDAGALLDVLVADLSRDMIDDYPASDPRWGESLPRDICSSSASLILLHQLNDKMQAHEFYLQFLKKGGLWNRLFRVEVRDGMLNTRMLLCEHAEKLEAVKSLRDIHTEYAQVIDRVIVKVVGQRSSVAPSNSLTPQDLFYREVSRVDELFVCLVDHEEQLLSGNVTSRDTVKLVSTVNIIIMTMLYSALKYRESRAALYQCAAPVSGSQLGREEYVAWTASTGHRGLRAVIHRQHVLIVERGLPECQTSQEKAYLFQQLFELTDIVLDGFRVQLDSIKATSGGQHTDIFRQYENERNLLIESFMTHKQYERAASLAEKYCHFSVLIRICEELDNQDRLKQYMNQFQDKGFSDFVFKWYMEAGKRGKLMTSELSSNPLLSRFLQTKENQFISWLHDINAGNYFQAHSTLLNLANEEEKYAGKKKTLLSLSKLAALASDDLPDSVRSNIEDIDNELDLLLHQEQLLNCPEIKEHLGISDVDNMNVLNPVQLIELHIGEYNVNANEYDFKKAIDLITFVLGRNEDVNVNELLVTIWARALLRNSWENTSATDPMDVCRDTIFFRTVELVSQDMKLDQFLPPVENLLASDLLQDISQSRDFEYLVRAMYERIQREMQEGD